MQMYSRRISLSEFKQIGIIVLLAASRLGLAGTSDTDWPSYGHDAGAARFSPLRQITKQNVSQLERAWTFHLGETGSEATPLVVNGVMYVTAANGIFALQPETGKLLWKFETDSVARRGLAYWPGDRSTHARLFVGVQNGKLLALDAVTGKPATAFGKEGFLDLKDGVQGGLKDARFSLTSPPAIYKNIVITGGNNNELAPSRGAYGDVRGWDAQTGRLLWTFHTVPRGGEPGNETWPKDGWQNRSGVNVWGFMTVDVERGLVFLPIGCPTSDMYGADRHGNGLYANSVVALDAATGHLRWFQQLVHHDLWDYDLAAPPTLIEIRHGRSSIPAVAQITKMGLLFLFDRTNGRPVYGIDERSVPQSEAPGEQSSRTQPFPRKPEPLARMTFRKEELYTATPEHAAFCRELYEKNNMFSPGPFTPMRTHGNALTFPSTLGGGNWGGVSYDPTLRLVFANIMNLGQWGHMEPRQNPKTGETTYVRTAAQGGPYARFWDPRNHIPCQQPPFGELVAVNVDTGTIAWRKPLGTIEELEQRGLNETGTLNLGGSIVTASGLLFIGATNDSRLRAFDAKIGRELWNTKIDASGYATPSTFLGRNGHQYIVIVAGGGSYWGGKASDSVIAFSLPEKTIHE